MNKLFKISVLNFHTKAKKGCDASEYTEGLNSNILAVFLFVTLVTLKVSLTYQLAKQSSQATYHPASEYIQEARRR